jgi:hypothetical protein
MAGNRSAVFSNWIGKSKLRRFAALLVFWIIFDQLFGLASHGMIRWPRPSWTHSIFYGSWMAFWFTILSIGWRPRTDG